ncbi:MAG: hypothetical protein V3S29_12915 [bacterium]
MAGKKDPGSLNPNRPLASAIGLGLAALALLSGLAACSPSVNGGLSVERGRRLMEQRKFDDAREHFTKLMAKHPDLREVAWQYLLRIQKAAQPTPTPPEKPSAAQAAPAAGFVCQDRHPGETDDIGKKVVSASFIEADLREALLEISTQTGVSIIPDETVTGILSASIAEMPLEEALEMILAPNNFSFRRIRNFYLVGESSPENPSFHLLSETCLFKPAHLLPEEILDLLAPFYKPFINLQQRRGLLTVVAPQSMQRRIQRDVLNFDREPPQVLLELTIVEVTSRGREMLGIDWSNGKSPTEAGATLGNTSSTSGGAGLFGVNLTTADSLTTKTFQATVNWLSETGEATLRANPSIVTLDGHEAVFSSIHRSWVDPTPESTTKKKEEIRYGVTMRIIPRISENREVVLNIVSAEVSDLTVNSMGNPEVISHSISTKVRMRQGEALVLGGLLQKKKTYRVTKVPLLGDIPIFGYFFKSEAERSRETEILIVIKPTVLSSGRVALRSGPTAAAGLARQK